MPTRIVEAECDQVLHAKLPHVAQGHRRAGFVFLLDHNRMIAGRNGVSDRPVILAYMNATTASCQVDEVPNLELDAKEIEFLNWKSMSISALPNPLKHPCSRMLPSVIGAPGGCFGVIGLGRD
jgi:hypothetical protein